ncbi:hypothetical protein KJN74_05900 [Candidatus Bathyarchaeota archaeon]|nr:hypothetical protein [Candidatus Bathyarchaeota archaeon]
MCFRLDEIIAYIEVEVNPTEDLEKVKHAVENIFGILPFKIKSKTWGKLLVATRIGFEGLIKFANLLKREQILAAARKVFRSVMNESSITFYLNKQAAYAGHISFSEQTAESPLGPIKVQIRTRSPRKLINLLAPKPPKKIRRNLLRPR